MLTGINNEIVKTGPANFIRGELYFYQNIPTELSIFFPNLLKYHCVDDNTTELTIDYIHGIPLYFLYESQTLTTQILDKCFDLLDQLHNWSKIPTITDEKIKANYFDKLKNRFNEKDYPFENAVSVFDNLLENLEKHYQPKKVSIIHGDFWFSNIILTYTDEIKCIDMKGQVFNELSLNGDAYYDYGKLYQSILGYDIILHKKQIPKNYKESIEKYFLEKCIEKKINIDYLKWVTKSLIFGTFHSLPLNISKKEIWNWYQSL